MGRFCLVMNGPYVVYKTLIRDDHKGWDVYQEPGGCENLLQWWSQKREGLSTTGHFVYLLLYMILQTKNIQILLRRTFKLFNLARTQSGLQCKLI